ncbi:cytochrome P450 [Daedalea quercina L-15889]|uniref:Cytochrome P450 n=1 Tax=Daedalea quercina L-15889 TaxID=1314783 RepID=A0A165PAE2_9APHY|nr:cytochrome P450 [Daedalea quercina L-15889]
MYYIVIVLSAALFTFAALYFKSGNKSLRRKLPPGPPGIPILGNLLQLPALRPHPKLSEWATKYGEIFYLQLGCQDVVVLNTAEAADELLSRRSNNYSGRAVPHVAHDILRDGLGMTFIPYGPAWRVLRKALQSILGPGPSKQLRLFQELESRVLLYDLLCHGDQSIVKESRKDPHEAIPDGHWYALVRRYSTSVVLYSIYGKRANRFLNNPDLHRIYDIIDNMVQMAQPGNFLADTFPILRRLPDILAPWRVEARQLHLRERGLWEGLVDDCKASMQAGEERGGFINSYLNARAMAGHANAPGNGFAEGEWMQDKFLAFGAGTVLEAGSDTTTMSITTFMLYMLNHPQVLQKARDEIDAVVGTQRMPDFDDEERLPYFVACVKEMLRHRPATPQGTSIQSIPHATMEDDFYKEYYIPKGCTVIGNVWAIHRNPERFYNPNAFIPERFYEEGKPTRWGSGPDSQDRELYGFGWGRRFCQGSYIAQASLFITLCRLIWGIDFSAPLDPKTQRPIIPDIANEEATWSEGFVSVPYPYQVRFSPRSAKHAELIRNSFEEVQSEWRRMNLEVDER